MIEAIGTIPVGATPKLFYPPAFTRAQYDIQNASLAAWWPTVSKTGPNLTDDVAANVLTASGTPTFSADADFVTVIDFDQGNPDYFDSSTMPATAEPFSLSAWFRFNAQDQIAFVLGLASVNRLNWHSIHVYRSGGTTRFRAWSNKSGSYSHYAEASVADSTWYHVAAVFETTSSRKIYVDGRLIQTDTNTASSMPTLDRVVVGRRDEVNGGPALDGSLADLRIYNAALTAAEVQQLAASPYDLYQLESGGAAISYFRRSLFLRSGSRGVIE